MTTTRSNLFEAYARLKIMAERNKRQARKAGRENNPVKSRVLRAIARSEENQASLLLKLLADEVTETDAYLDALRHDLRRQGDVHFNRMHDQAKEDADLDATILTNKLRRTTSLNAVLAHQALTKKNPKDVPLLVCPGCGLVTVKNAPPICRICGSSQDKFKKVK